MIWEEVDCKVLKLCTTCSLHPMRVLTWQQQVGFGEGSVYTNLIPTLWGKEAVSARV